MRSRRQFVSCVVSVVLIGCALLYGNAPDPAADLNTYRGLKLGAVTPDEIVAALGASPIVTANKEDLRYPSEGNSALNDRMYFRRGKLALVTSASPDERFPDRAAITQQFGDPEQSVRFQTQEYLDYTSRGFRFICQADGPTSGILYFEPHRRRVPEGYPNARIDLSRDLPPAQEATPPGDFRVGVAQVSIAPEKFDRLVAKKEAKPHLAEDLFARAVVFQNNERKIAFVGLDVFGMGQWDIDPLLASLAKQGLPDVIVGMSHTHANVDTIGFYGYYPRDYSKYVMRRTEEAVLEAAANVQPIKMLKAGSVEMPLAGGRVVDLIRNGRDPGLFDPTVNLIQAIGMDGKPIANLMQLTCHPEVIRLENTGGLSPDFVGRLCRDVAAELGGQSIFLNGPLGGMVTPDTRERTQEAAEAMGSALAKYVIDAAREATPMTSYALWRHRRPVEYPITGENVLAFMKNTPEPTDFYQGRARAEMNVVWIGDAQFVTIPGELLPDIGFEITSRMSGRLRAIVGLANGQLGYLIPSFDFRAGEYEERTGPGAAGGEITRTVGLELAAMRPPVK